MLLLLLLLLMVTDAATCSHLTCGAPVVSAQPQRQLLPAPLRQRNQAMRGDGEDSG